MRGSRTIDPEGAELRGLAEVVDFTGLNVLELGCGYGRLTWRYAGAAASVVAADPDRESILEARRTIPDGLRDRVRLKVAGAAQAVVPRSSIDLAFFSWSL